MLPFISPIIDRRIRIALVGCGRISRNHIKAIAAHHERAELVAICDTQAERLEQAQELINQAAAQTTQVLPRTRLNSTHTANFWKQLVQVIHRMDLVVLATPSGLHPGQVISAAEAGRVCVPEKPMVTRWVRWCRNGESL